MPWSEEAEQHVLACCLLDGSDTIERCLEGKLTADSFFSAANRVVFEVILDLHRVSPPVTLEVLAEELKTRRLLESIGGFSYLMQVTGRIPTTAHAAYFIQKVREQEVLRSLIKTATGAVEQCYSYTGGIDELMTNVEAKMRDVAEAARAVDRPKSVPLISLQYPADDDPDILLGAEDYLGRGGIMLGIAHAGAGKSSFLYDACMTWGLGRPWMGIRASRPMRILVIQSEDSERYCGKIAASFVHAHNLSGDERSLLEKNVHIVGMVGVTGQAFFSEMQRLVVLHEPDIVAINPIYDYAEGDIAKAEAAKPFLDGLAWVNRFKKFAYVLIHHTGKPTPKDNKGKRAQVEDWESVYMGYGSSYFANKPRCSWLLEPRAGKSGRYALKLGKAGRNAGVVREVDDGHGGRRVEPVTSIPMRHSQGRIVVHGKERPLVLWEPDEWDSDENQPAAQEAAKPAPKPEPVKKGGKPMRFADEWMCCYFPASTAEAESIGIIFKRALGGSGVAKSTFYDARDRMHQNGWIEQLDLGPWRRTKDGDDWALRWKNLKKGEPVSEQKVIDFQAATQAPSVTPDDVVQL
jgi:hypothetical protein